MDWTPTISELSGPRYQRIVEAMEANIAAGRLVRGQQLPTQRALAKALGIDLTTVTRAYTEAQRRGIMEARVGQGSFVSETSARRAVDLPHPVAIDLSMNVPPHPLEAQLDERIIAGMEAIRAQSGLTAYLNYQPPGGSAHEREVAARWMRAPWPSRPPIISGYGCPRVAPMSQRICCGMDSRSWQAMPSPWMEHRHMRHASRWARRATDRN
ncbi:GntR family transcriptional regulator [Bradyrhizobium sp. WSM1743]|uniref:GntR family transcriptional regulator n=1 Tax=Bradyrhizobium sp. WSM1743 TaxID=318996 RepID=UPI000421F199|nr:GntR family transcriptional regulator [Bradyrhizobium sp. WSM1743]